MNDSIISRWIFRIYFDWIDCLIATDPNGFCLQSVSVLNLFRSNYEYFFFKFDIIFTFRISRKKKLIDIDRFREKYSFVENSLASKLLKIIPSTKFYSIIICSVETVSLIDARFQITRLAKDIVEKEHRRLINFWDSSKGRETPSKDKGEYLYRAKGNFISKSSLDISHSQRHEASRLRITKPKFNRKATRSRRAC